VEPARYFADHAYPLTVGAPNKHEAPLGPWPLGEGAVWGVFDHERKIEEMHSGASKKPMKQHENDVIFIVF